MTRDHMQSLFSLHFTMPPKSWWLKVISISALIFICGWLFSLRFSIGVNPQVMGCIKGTIFVVDHKDRTPVIGKVFAYHAMQAEPVYANGTLMAKFVAAGPGDTVEVTPDFRILVNNNEFARGLPHLASLNEEAIKRFIGKRELKANQYWMLGTLPKSFDSRYWGPISSEQIVGRAYVLF